MKSKTVGVVLAIFFGGLGFQWFYVGKIGKGILYLLTAGLFGIGWIISIFTICGAVDVYNAVHYYRFNANANANVNNIVINVPGQGQYQYEATQLPQAQQASKGKNY